MTQTANFDKIQSAYNSFENLPELSYNCYTSLIEKNELIWKLLKYNSPDAWRQSKPNLTPEEKGALIYDGSEDATLFRAFLDIGQPDVFTHEVAIIRICPYYVAGRNRAVGLIEMSFEVFCHNKINHLSNYQTRVETITQQFLKVFNGANIGGLGVLYFDRLGDQNDKIIHTGQLPFKGKQIIMTTNIA